MIKQRHISCLNGISWAFIDEKNYDRVVESSGQDQTARMCRQILIHTLRKINQWSRFLKAKGHFII